MSSRIIGVDLGTYSVKVVVSSPGFRQAQVEEVIERPVPMGDEPHLLRASAVAGEILANYRGEEDTTYVAISGDKVFLHVLEFEFKIVKRAVLESAVGSVLEGVLPIDLEDMVYAFEQLPRVSEIVPTAEEVGDEEPTFVSGIPSKSTKHGRVAAPISGMRILAAATQRSRGEEFLVALQAHGVDPRGLLAAPAPYARLAEKIGGLEHDSNPIGILDIGHMRSDFCLGKGGRPIFARSIARGGHHLTALLSRSWNMDYRQCERTKHENGFVASHAQPASSESAAQISALLSGELGTLVRELRRTINSCRAKTGFDTEKIVLVGGGSRLSGIAPYLSEELGIPVTLVSGEHGQHLLGTLASAAALDVCALALGIAIDGASSKPSFDLRQGALAAKVDLSFLKTKKRALATSAVAVMAFGVLSGLVGVNKLKAAEKRLAPLVAEESVNAFGEQLSASEVLDRVGPVQSARSVNPVPSMTGYDMMLAFNEALPKKDKVVLDVTDIDIKPGKVVIKASSSPFGETSALQGIKNLEESLRASKCFKEFTSPESQPSANEGRQFTLSIKSDCNK